MTEIDHIIKTRRAIFPAMFSDQKIEDKLVLKLLENATWAPNHKKTEPWRFIIFKETGLNALSEFCAESYREASSAKQAFSNLKYEKTKKKVMQSSHVIAIILNRSTEVTIPEWEEIAAVAAAVQNLWLSAEAHGVAGYWSTPGYLSGASEFFNLSENQKCLGFFYLGVKDPSVQIEGKRGPIEEKIVWRSEA